VRAAGRCRPGRAAQDTALARAGDDDLVASSGPATKCLDLDMLAAAAAPGSPHDTLEMPVVTADLADALPAARTEDATIQPA